MTTSMMEMGQNHMNERILDLTLEIIYLLTGEDYEVVRRMSGKPLAPSSRLHRTSPITVPPPHCLTTEVTSAKKILEVTKKMTELLTGEVPIRCQDVTVYFSMEEWEYLEGHKDHYKNVMMENQQLLSYVIMKENNLPNGILILTLEIVCLLTGEDCTVVKKSSIENNIRRRSHRLSTRQREREGPITMNPPPLLTLQKNNEQKILEVTNKMMELLTGEVPIRCQDVTVYFSMEEWEYLEEHKDLYKDVMMENQPPLTSLGKRRLYCKGESSIETMYSVSCHLDKASPVDVVYLDFAKAFDAVPHKCLLYKIRRKSRYSKYTSQTFPIGEINGSL
ncbi:uncharacterized protein [Aquarana catesbeiana]|uniref:uncharacterized protein n=1 Tax=Aquarana catesbeiana TaxID=8400 RepID=UPI003CC9C5C6